MDGASAEKVARGVAVDVGVRPKAVSTRGAVRHLFTHRDVTAEVFRVDATPPGGRPGAADRRWVGAQDLETLGVSSFTRKTIALGLS